MENINTFQSVIEKVASSVGPQNENENENEDSSVKGNLGNQDEQNIKKDGSETKATEKEKTRHCQKN